MQSTQYPKQEHKTCDKGWWSVTARVYWDLTGQTGSDGGWLWTKPGPTSYLGENVWWL